MNQYTFPGKVKIVKTIKKNLRTKQKNNIKNHVESFVNYVTLFLPPSTMSHNEA